MFFESKCFMKLIYNELRGVKSDIKILRVAQHLELIFPLMNLQALSCSSLLLTGNLLKTNIFSEFNLVLSRHFLSWLPSVLLSASSSFLKKCGSSFKVHKCRSVSGFDRACWMVLTLVGVTHVPINSSLTAWAAAPCLVTNCPSVGWLSSQSPFKVS